MRYVGTTLLDLAGFPCLISIERQRQTFGQKMIIDFTHNILIGIKVVQAPRVYSSLEGTR